MPRARSADRAPRRGARGRPTSAGSRASRSRSNTTAPCSCASRHTDRSCRVRPFASRASSPQRTSSVARPVAAIARRPAVARPTPSAPCRITTAPSRTWTTGRPGASAGRARCTSIAEVSRATLARSGSSSRWPRASSSTRSDARTGRRNSDTAASAEVSTRPRRASRSTARAGSGAAPSATSRSSTCTLSPCIPGANSACAAADTTGSSSMQASSHSASSSGGARSSLARSSVMGEADAGGGAPRRTASSNPSVSSANSSIGAPGSQPAVRPSLTKRAMRASAHRARTESSSKCGNGLTDRDIALMRPLSARPVAGCVTRHRNSSPPPNGRRARSRVSLQGTGPEMLPRAAGRRPRSHAMFESGPYAVSTGARLCVGRRGRQDPEEVDRPE